MQNVLILGILLSTRILPYGRKHGFFSFLAGGWEGILENHRPVFPIHFFFLISIASGQVDRTLEHTNPGLTPNGYFYVPVTSASSDRANSASVAAPQEWADQAFAERAGLCNLFLAPQQVDAKWAWVWWHTQADYSLWNTSKTENVQKCKNWRPQDPAELSLSLWGVPQSVAVHQGNCHCWGTHGACSLLPRAASGLPVPRAGTRRATRYSQTGKQNFAIYWLKRALIVYSDITVA